jgi:hypothetical protein
MKHFLKFLTLYSTKLKLTLNPEGAQGALLLAIIANRIGNPSHSGCVGKQIFSKYQNEQISSHIFLFSIFLKRN